MISEGDVMWWSEEGYEFKATFVRFDGADCIVEDALGKNVGVEPWRKLPVPRDIDITVKITTVINNGWNVTKGKPMNSTMVKYTRIKPIEFNL